MDASLYHLIYDNYVPMIILRIVVFLISYIAHLLHLKEFMNVSYNNDSRLSLEQLPVTETEITEPQATQYKTSMTESEFTKFRCTKSMPAESKVVCTTSTL